jgi:hypothetical protein
MLRVTVENTGTGGTITGPNGFTCVDPICALDVLPGTVVSLRGLAATDTWFAGWSSDQCGGNFDCELTVDTNLVVKAEFSATPNRIFVTSTTTDGAMGGIAGADAICAARANAASLNGTFIAYISDGTTSALSRVVGSRGWVRVDGAPYADAPTAFGTGEIVFPPRLDEFGNDLGNVIVFSGTNNGNVNANRCLEWTSSDGAEDGFVNETGFGSDSVGGFQAACSQQAHLLCVETGRAIQVATRFDTGKQSFMSRSGWAPGGGRASADAHCASQAASAGLTGTFLAAIATTTESIKSRFSPTAVYRRPDGVRLLRTSGVFANDWLDVSPELDQLGASLRADFWTGTQRFDQVSASGADNCNDWNDAVDTSSAIQHWTTNTNLADPAKTGGCDGAVPILCLEQ